MEECKVFIGRLIAMILVCTLVGAAARAARIDAESVSQARGNQLFVSKGCFECHGYVAQGSIMSGPSIAPAPISFTAMAAYIRAPKGQMPPYSKKILSDAELRDIHAYLESIPSNPKLESIALLKDSRSPDVTIAPAATRLGATVFSASCAACHGGLGEGGMGPTLKGIAYKRGVDGIAEFVRNPVGAMPRLYPKVLSDQEVRDVAQYVATLK